MNAIDASLTDEQNALLTTAREQLVEHGFDLLAVLELPGLRLHTLNQAGRRLLFCDSNESVDDLPWTDLVSDALWQTLRTTAVPAVRQGRIWRGGGILRTRAGTELPARLFLIGLPDSTTAGEFAVLAGIDDSRHHMLEAVLQHEKTLLHALLDNLPDAIWFKDREGRFIRVNAVKARQSGDRGPFDLVGQTDFDLFAPSRARRVHELEQRIIATGEAVMDAEEQETWPDGRTTWVSSSNMPLRDARGRIVGTFGMSRDITARKRAGEERLKMEAQLHLAQKMESIGRLAAGVAHEINTPTQYITDNTHFLAEAFIQIARVLASHRAVRECAATHPDCASALHASATTETEAEIDYLVAEIPRTLEQTIEGISRIARIVQSLRDFSHPGSPEKQPTDLNHAVETAVAVSRHEWKLVAEVVTELDGSLPPVPCVLDEVNQVVLNLIVNAAHAIADVVAEGPGVRGRITIRTRHDGEWATLEVADTGTGIPATVQQRVFEPFFTTKPQGKGTGQGLAIVHNVIVKNHHGIVDFTTEPGRGTTFRLRLPVLPAAA